MSPAVMARSWSPTTGMGSEVGHIATMLAGQKVEKSPLTKQVDRLTIFIIGMAGLAFSASS